MSLPKETDLFPLIKMWLEEQDYKVYAEVKGCDVVARKGKELVLIEIKRTVNMSLVHQIIRRQEVGALVYGAICAPKAYDDKAWSNTIRLFRRLGAGLITVSVATGGVEVLMQPVKPAKALRKPIEKAYWKELDGRTMDVNLGGSPGWDNMDSWKEKALRVAVAIERLGPSTKHVLSLAGASSVTGSILRANRHGWFERVKPGVFGLTDEGREALTRYADLADRIREQVNKVVENMEEK